MNTKLAKVNEPCSTIPWYRQQLLVFALQLFSTLFLIELSVVGRMLDIRAEFPVRVIVLHVLFQAYALVLAVRP